jgi:inward rectifier potassium channel
MHVIDETSPLAHASPEICKTDEVELIVSVVGTDETTLQPVHGRIRYVATEILWGYRLADVLSERPDGRLNLDVRRFHEVVRMDPTPAFPYPRPEDDTAAKRPAERDALGIRGGS